MVPIDLATGSSEFLVTFTESRKADSAIRHTTKQV